MKEKKFIPFKVAEQVLAEKTFYGFTAKRKQNSRIIYRFKSVKWPYIMVRILTFKLDADDIQSERIILGVKINEKEMTGWKEFMTELTELTKYKPRKK